MVSFPQVPHQSPVYTSPLPIRATRPAHLILRDFITRTILGEQYKSLTFYLSLSLSMYIYFLFSLTIDSLYMKTLFHLQKFIRPAANP